MAAFGQATTRWVTDPPPGDLDARLREAFADLNILIGDIDDCLSTVRPGSDN